METTLTNTAETAPTTAAEGVKLLNKQMVVSWRTRKTETGFAYYVVGIEYQKFTYIFKGSAVTRGKAETAVKKALRYFRQQAAKLPA